MRSYLTDTEQRSYSVDPVAGFTSTFFQNRRFLNIKRRFVHMRARGNPGRGTTEPSDFLVSSRVLTPRPWFKKVFSDVFLFLFFLFVFFCFFAFLPEA